MLDLGSQTRIFNWEVTGWHAFMIAPAGRKESIPPFWTKVILGKICATTHAITIGGRAAPAWGPVTKVSGPVGLDEGHSYLQRWTNGHDTD